MRILRVYVLSIAAGLAAAALSFHDSAHSAPITYTLSITETSGATPFGPDDVSSLSFAGGTGIFTQRINSLSPILLSLGESGTNLFQIDFEAFDQASAPPLDLGTYAFNNVLIGSIALSGTEVPIDTVTFSYVTESFTATPLPATLPLFASGLGFVGYLTRRKKRAQALAAA